MSERITQAELARREGVSRATITRWIQQGRISGPGLDGRLDPAQAHQERLLTESPLPKHQGAKAWHAAEKARRRAQGPDPDQAPDHEPDNERAGDGGRATPPPRPEPAAATHSALSAKQQDLSAALKLETWRLQKAKAEQANMALDREAGLLIERSVVEYLLRDLGESVQAELGHFADLHAAELASARGDAALVRQRLADATHATLERIAEHLQRRAGELLPVIEAPTEGKSAA